mmetsp:Transcript_23080/g.56979  ORF Transcript_23080/g.56979 Transcript_23080/m.56979 type:complete len:204 (-) Transcript_23080:592-1203(-)
MLRATGYDERAGARRGRQGGRLRTVALAQEGRRPVSSRDVSERPQRKEERRKERQRAQRWGWQKERSQMREGWRSALCVALSHRLGEQSRWREHRRRACSRAAQARSAAPPDRAAASRRGWHTSRPSSGTERQRCRSWRWRPSAQARTRHRRDDAPHDPSARATEPGETGARTARTPPTTRPPRASSHCLSPVRVPYKEECRT